MYVLYPLRWGFCGGFNIGVSLTGLDCLLTDSGSLSVYLIQNADWNNQTNYEWNCRLNL